jgi:hypothetical protein
MGDAVLLFFALISFSAVNAAICLLLVNVYDSSNFIVGPLVWATSFGMSIQSAQNLLIFSHFCR